MSFSVRLADGSRPLTEKRVVSLPLGPASTALGTAPAFCLCHDRGGTAPSAPSPSEPSFLCSVLAVTRPGSLTSLLGPTCWISLKNKPHSGIRMRSAVLREHRWAEPAVRAAASCRGCGAGSSTLSGLLASQGHSQRVLNTLAHFLKSFICVPSVLLLLFSMGFYRTVSSGYC